MSLFQSVWLYLKCQRCGKVFETYIRFHSELNDDSDFRLGERVPDGVHLSVGEIYEGNADRYCEVCYRNWTAAQSIAAYESLAALIEQGCVYAKDGESGTTLSAADILEYGRRYTDEEVINVPYLNVSGPYFEELELCLGNDRVVVGDAMEDGHWEEFLSILDPLLNRRLREAGWENLQDPCEDFHVYLDEERRIVVADLDGRQLVRFGEGERFA